MKELEQIVEEARAAFEGIEDAALLEQEKARFLGKSGSLTGLLKKLGGLPAEERPQAGARINDAKLAVENLLQARRRAIQDAALAKRLEEERLDVTLPGRGAGTGGLHPVTRTLDRVAALFRTMGFEVADGPEIETDYYNFSALNQP